MNSKHFVLCFSEASSQLLSVSCCQNMSGAPYLLTTFHSPFPQETLASWSGSQHYSMTASPHYFSYLHSRGLCTLYKVFIRLQKEHETNSVKLPACQACFDSMVSPAHTKSSHISAKFKKCNASSFHGDIF